MVDIKFIHGDCLEIMPTLADKSIDMILCDLPYGTTACKWDTIIPFEPLWKQYKRLIKDNGAIVLTASQPFTSALVMSNPDMFKYEIIWEKNKPSGIATANKMPMKNHENICVFYKSQPIFNAIKSETKSISSLNNALKGYTNQNKSLSNITGLKGVPVKWSKMINPRTVLRFNVVGNRDKNRVHPTQKPVALFEYLIRTYTNEGDTVLDNCAGSGTTGIAALHTKRNAILIEKDEQYFNAAKERFDRETRQVAMW
jgi:site-specific DNA-methyltransferase (adenine-specific)